MPAVSGVAQARLLIAARRYQDAVAALTRVLAGAPDDDEALCLLAQARLELDEADLALEAAQAALRVSPEKEWALRLASLALARLGRFSEARAAADEAVRVAPQLWQAHVQRAQVDISAAAITPATRDAVRRAIELAPGEPATHNTYGRVALADAQLKVAERAFREALRLDPQNAAAQNNLGVALLRQRKLGRATSMIIGAAGLDPTSPTYVRNVGVSIRAWFSYLALAGLILAEVAATDQSRSPGVGRAAVPTSGHVGLLTACTLIDLALAGFIWWRMWRVAGAVLGRYLASSLRRDHGMRAMIVAPNAGLACFTVAGLLGFPAATPWLWISGGCNLATIILGRAISWLTRRRRRISGRGRRPG